LANNLPNCRSPMLSSGTPQRLLSFLIYWKPEPRAPRNGTDATAIGAWAISNGSSEGAPECETSRD
jgi:hypothetical protein